MAPLPSEELDLMSSRKYFEHKQEAGLAFESNTKLQIKGFDPDRGRYRGAALRCREGGGGTKKLHYW